METSNESRSTRKMLRVVSVVLLVGILVGAAPSDELLDAIHLQESSGKLHVEDRLDDVSIARGPFQFHRQAWVDATKFLKVSWPYSQAHDYGKARACASGYMQYWGVHYGRTTEEDYARIFNGGPKGWRKASTRVYWQQVSAHIREGKRVRKGERSLEATSNPKKRIYPGTGGESERLMCDLSIELEVVRQTAALDSRRHADEVCALRNQIHTLSSDLAEALETIEELESKDVKEELPTYDRHCQACKGKGTVDVEHGLIGICEECGGVGKVG